MIAYRFASGLGSGKPTTFSYAYLIASLLVAVTATSVALVSSVPLSRGSLTPERSARHIVSASWLSLVVVAGAAGVFALAGAPVAKLALGSSYGGSDRDRARAPRRLPRVLDDRLDRALGRVPAAVRARAGAHGSRCSRSRRSRFRCRSTGPAARSLGLAGIAVGLAITTTGILVVLLVALDALVGHRARPAGRRARLRAHRRRGVRCRVAARLGPSGRSDRLRRLRGRRSRSGGRRGCVRRGSTCEAFSSAPRPAARLGCSRARPRHRRCRLHRLASRRPPARLAATRSDPRLARPAGP